MCRRSEMKKIVYILIAACVLVSCGNDCFRVSGLVSHGAGETLYLEHCGLTQTDLIDSVVLKPSGRFSFSAPRPEYPDLYRLRIGKSTLMLAIDSMEKITVEASAMQLGAATIDGSEKSIQLQDLRQSIRENTPESHKAFARQIILSNPVSIVAYYALFQQKAGLPVFDIYAKADRPYFSAVATSFNTWMPNYVRSKVLYNQVLDVINNERRARNAATIQAFIEESESAFLDITLPDEDGVDQSLSQYKGKVIVLDFASIAMDRYKGYLYEMREVYNKYHSRGLEIYEVYPDPNRLVWEDQVRALPWTTVCTEKGLFDPVFGSYNVQAIPTLFLFNIKGEVVGRFSDFGNLKKALEKLL